MRDTRHLCLRLARCAEVTSSENVGREEAERFKDEDEVCQAGWCIQASNDTGPTSKQMNMDDVS